MTLDLDDIDPRLSPVVADICDDEFRRYSQSFRRNGIVILSEILTLEVRLAVRREVDRLLGSFAERRDLRLATTGYTRRSMSVVPSETIAAHSELITSIYRDKTFVDTLAWVAGEPLFSCPKADEEFLITRQEQAGDTHGWHWGDFSYALIWILETPPLDLGGQLQCIPHTDWDKSSPSILRYMVENPISTYQFVPNDVYLLRSDTTMHRTVPLQADATRIILNMTWASEHDLNWVAQEDDRWWDDANVMAAVPSADQA